MSQSKGTPSLFVGFGRAAMGLGALLVFVWAVLWAIEAFGGPDWTMPRALLTSAGTMIGLGWIVTFLATHRSDLPRTRSDDQEA